MIIVCMIQLQIIMILVPKIGLNLVYPTKQILKILSQFTMPMRFCTGIGVIGLHDRT